MQGILRDQNNPRPVRMHQMSMGMRCCTDSYHNTQKWMHVRLIPAQSTMKFVIRLCASEVDRKSIHSDVYHEGRWLLWYWILSQIITMQSVHTPCRPPPAAETTLRNDLRIREYCMVIPFTIRMWFSKKASFSHWQTNKLNADIHDSRWISASFLCLK